jgi:hypothetical protein
MAIKFRQTDEGFTWVFKAPTVPEQIKRLKEWAATNQALVPIVRLGVGADGFGQPGTFDDGGWRFGRRLSAKEPGARGEQAQSDEEKERAERHLRRSGS